MKPEGTYLSKQNQIHLAAAAAGFIVTTGVALASGIPVAWATPMYFWLGWPLMCTVIYLLARAYPERPWRWTLSMMLGQVFSSIFFGGGALVPVAMAYVTLLSIPQFFAGEMGARAGLAQRVDPAVTGADVTDDSQDKT
jgi:hypothetical protein